MTTRRLLIAAIAAAAILLFTAWRQQWFAGYPDWTETERATLRTLSLDRLPPLPPDPTNAVADADAAARFGQRLFFDTRFSANGAISCASCHLPERRFTDGLPKGRGLGLSARNTRSFVGTAYSPWQYWDGRKDSQWSQALSPLEDPAEHGTTRMHVARIVAADRDYRERYEALFGALPDFSDTERFPVDAAPATEFASQWQSMQAADRDQVNRVFTNIGKAIAAFERKILPGPARFDTFLKAVEDADRSEQKAIFSRDEARGLRLFIGKARCIECHNGPLLTNHEFHNTGILSFPGELPDRGRIDGVRQVLEDPFNCLGAYSDDPDRYCPELEFVRSGVELIGAMRTPTLRNLSGTEPYGHKGQLATLGDVLDNYNRAPLAMIGHNETEEPLRLSGVELQQLEAFLLTLDAPLATAPEWLTKPD